MSDSVQTQPGDPNRPYGRLGSPGDGSSRVGDEQLLIDFVLGQCSPADEGQVRRRLADDPSFAELHRGISQTFSLLEAWRAPEPPDELVERTMQRVRALRRTEALIEAQPVAAHRLRLPTFAWRELAALAAVVVLAIGMVLVPSWRQARQLADRQLCQSNIAQIGIGLAHYANGNNDRLPGVAASSGNWLPRPGEPLASNSAGLFRLVREDLAKPEMFQCPAAGGASFVVAAGMADFPARQNIGYSYQYSLDGGLNRSALKRVAGKMAILADTTPVFRDGRFRGDCAACSPNHGGTGQNVLYLDGRSKWAESCEVGVDGNNIWLADGVREYTGREKPGSPFDSFLLPRAGQ